jgi:acyl carrier protein
MLPVPDQERPELDDSFVAPSTPVERQLAAIWREVLKLEPIGIRDDFFDLGGHSLLAIQVITRLRDIYGVSLALGTLLAAPTIEVLAQRVEAALYLKDGADSTIDMDEVEREEIEF